MMIPVAGQSTNPPTHSSRQAYIARGVIVSSGLLVLALLAWVHLGLGALLFPPPLGPARQVASAGRFQVALLADSREILVGEHNTILLEVTDAAHHIVSSAIVTVDAEMVTMPMPVPTVTATWVHGRYTAHPIFSMAGPWKLTVTIRTSGQPAVHAIFPVSVRWHA